MKHALIFGCGYLGHRVARQWQADGWTVHVATRSRERAQQFRAEGLLPLVADILQPDTLAELPEVDATLFAVGWDRSSGDILTLYQQGVRNVLSAVAGRTKTFLYISSTGVYGTAEGGWVDEQTPPDPERAGGEASLAAEEELAAAPAPPHKAILRLAGIYGPDRVPFLERLRIGRPLATPHQGWLNLIHVDDAVTVVVDIERWLHQQEADGKPHLFCVSDGTPVARGDYYREAARLLGAPLPEFTTPPADLPAASRARANKRIRNDLLIETIDPTFVFSDYRAGLAAILG